MAVHRVNAGGLVIFGLPCSSFCMPHLICTDFACSCALELKPCDPFEI